MPVTPKPTDRSPEHGHYRPLVRATPNDDLHPAPTRRWWPPIPFAYEDEARAYLSELQALGYDVREYPHRQDGKVCLVIGDEALPWRYIGAYRPPDHNMELPGLIEDDEP